MRQTARPAGAALALAGATALAGCAGRPARGAGLAFGFVAVVGALFSVAVVVLLLYMFYRLGTSLLGDA
ncbi:MAG: hypothetical protein ABEH58_08265 [Haloplanus sp.]